MHTSMKFLKAFSSVKIKISTQISKILGHMIKQPITKLSRFNLEQKDSLGTDILRTE